MPHAFAVGPRPDPEAVRSGGRGWSEDIVTLLWLEGLQLYCNRAMSGAAASPAKQVQITVAAWPHLSPPPPPGRLLTFNLGELPSDAMLSTFAPVTMGYAPTVAPAPSTVLRATAPAMAEVRRSRGGKAQGLDGGGSCARPNRWWWWWLGWKTAGGFLRRPCDARPVCFCSSADRRRSEGDGAEAQPDRGLLEPAWHRRGRL